MVDQAAAAVCCRPGSIPAGEGRDRPREGHRPVRSRRAIRPGRSTTTRASATMAALSDGPTLSTATLSRPTGPARRSGRRRVHPWRIAALVFIVIGLVVLVGGYLWVQRRGQSVGTARRPGHRHRAGRAPGSTDWRPRSRRKGVIGSSLAFRIWSQFHSHARVQCRAPTPSTRTPRSTDSRQGDRRPGPTCSRWTCRPASPWPRWPQRVGQLPGHDADAFLAAATGGTVRSPWQPAGVDQPRRPARHRHLHRGARGDRPRSCSPTWSTASTHLADTMRSGGRGRRSRATRPTR